MSSRLGKLKKLVKRFRSVVSGRDRWQTTCFGMSFPNPTMSLRSQHRRRRSARASLTVSAQPRMPLVLDEIQYAPELSLHQAAVDEAQARPGCSSDGFAAVAGHATLAESLAGRVAFLDLQGFSIQETGWR